MVGGEQHNCTGSLHENEKVKMFLLLTWQQTKRAVQKHATFLSQPLILTSNNTILCWKGLEGAVLIIYITHDWNT